MEIAAALSGKAYASAWKTCDKYSIEGNYYKAIKWGLIAARKSPKSPLAFECLGNAYYAVGYYGSSINMLKAATVIPFSMQYNKMSEYAGIARDYYRLGDLNNALLYDFKSIKSLESLNNTERNAYLGSESPVLNQMASIYYKTGYKNKSINYGAKAVSYARRGISFLRNEEGSINASGIPRIYYNLYKSSYAYDFMNVGEGYIYTGDYLKAKKYLLKALKMQKEIGGSGSNYFETLDYINLSKLYKIEGNYKKAISCYKKIYVLYNKRGNLLRARYYLHLIYRATH